MVQSTGNIALVILMLPATKIYVWHGVLVADSKVTAGCARLVTTPLKMHYVLRIQKKHCVLFRNLRTPC